MFLPIIYFYPRKTTTSYEEHINLVPKLEID